MPLNRPTKTELLSAVTEYLMQPGEDIKADQFFRRVAYNVMRIVEREDELSEQFKQEETNHLQNFLQLDSNNIDSLNSTLNHAIASKQIDITPELTRVLFIIAEAKLHIDNPKYLR
jgi:hypothetical protein